MAIEENPATRRIAQPLGLRPSLRTGFPATRPEGRPDELLFDWGKTPRGSQVMLYWPAVAAVDIVRLACLLDANNALEVADRHTVRLTVDAPLSFVPIPFAAGEVLAALVTIQLPPGLRREEEFKVVVRRVRSHRVTKIDFNASPAKAPQTGAWREVVGTFQVTIPVDGKEHLLVPEENALAILKWRLARMPAGDRWRPVLERFVAHVAARVDGFGGKAAAVPASLQGYPASRRVAPGWVFTGKVQEVIFDAFGVFEGFVLETASESHRFASREPAIGDLVLWACQERAVLSVVTDRGSHRIRNLIVRS